MEIPKLPKNVEDRIDNAFDQHNRLCRREKRYNDMLSYQLKLSSFATDAGCKYLFSNWARPDAFVLITFNDSEDWRWIRYKLITSDESVREFVESIVQKYIEEMFQYYVDRGCQPKPKKAPA